MALGNACIQLSDVSKFPQTNGSVWNLTNGSYHEVAECDLNGCIHGLICN